MAVCLSLPAYSCLCRSDDDPLSGGMDFGNFQGGESMTGSGYGVK